MASGGQFYKDTLGFSLLGKEKKRGGQRGGNQPRERWRGKPVDGFDPFLTDLDKKVKREAK